jgi:hypothetical protein
MVTVSRFLAFKLRGLHEFPYQSRSRIVLLTKTVPMQFILMKFIKRPLRQKKKADSSSLIKTVKDGHRFRWQFLFPTPLDLNPPIAFPVQHVLEICPHKKSQ